MVSESPLVDFDTPIFGREAEISLLQDALATVRSGQGRTILVAGEAGIGKTRLVDEFLATSKDCLVLRGWCLPETMEPLMAIREALRSGELEQSFTGFVPPRLLALLLVDRSGLLIAKAEREDLGFDADIFAGMLSAVAEFVQDVMGVAGPAHSGLNSLGYGDYRIILEGSREHNLVAIIHGHENEKFLLDLQNLLLEVLDTEADLIEASKKASIDLQPIEDRLRRLTTSSKYIGRELVADDPKLRRENVFENILLGMRRVSMQQPTILFLDDLQWADPSTLRLVHYLIRNTRSSRVLLVGTYRPEDILTALNDTPHPLRQMLDQLEAEELMLQIDLERLPEACVLELVTGTFTTLADADLVATRIYSETDGNSLFAKEILRLLVEDGVLTIQEGIWTISGDLAAAHLAPQMVAVIERRLHKLSGADFDVLQGAAVIGQEFAASLAACTLEMEIGNLQSVLLRLERQHSLIRGSEGRYRFDHAKIWEVLYEQTPSDLRRAYHLAIAECYLAQDEDEKEHHVFELSYHLDQAGDRRAYDYALVAAAGARREYALAEARAQYNVALRHSTDAELIARIRESLGEIAELEGDYSRAQDLFEQAYTGLTRPEARSRLNRKLADVAVNRAEFQLALEKARAAVDLATPDSIEYIHARHVESTAQRSLGHVAEAQSILEATLAIPNLSADLRGRGLHLLGTVLLRRGDLDAALGYLQEALAIRITEKDHRGQSGSLNNIGVIHWNRGNLEQALDYYQRSFDIFAEIGDQHGSGIALGNIGSIHLTRGELDTALEYCERSATIATEIGDQQGHGRMLANMGIIYQMRGDLDEALEVLTISLGLREETADRYGICHVLYDLASLQFERSDLGAAAEHCQRAFAQSMEIGLREIAGPALILTGRLQAARGEPFHDSIERGLALIEDDSIERAEALFRVADLVRASTPQEARTLLAESRELFQKLENHWWLSKVEELEQKLPAREDG